MSNERKEHRPLDANFPGEDQLSRLYREGSEALPPAHLDAVILDAARRAVHERPRCISFLPSRKWVVPLSLAAALLITLGLVRNIRQAIEAPVLIRAVPAPVGSQDGGSEQRGRATPPADEDEAAKGLQATEQESERVQERVLGPSLKLPPQSPAVDDPRISEEDKNTQGLARDVLPALSPQRQSQEKAPAASIPLPETARTREKRTSALNATAVELHSLPSLRAQSLPLSSNFRSAPAEPLGAPPQELPRGIELSKEEELSPEVWIKKIRALRRTGKHSEAEASFQAFKKRYPEYRIEDRLEK